MTTRCHQADSGGPETGCALFQACCGPDSRRCGVAAGRWVALEAETTGPGPGVHRSLTDWTDAARMVMLWRDRDLD